MEILNNIWTAISTENEALIYLSSIPLTFLEIFLITGIFINFLNISCTRNEKAVFIVVFSITTIISYYIVPAPYYSILDYFIMFILIKAIFKLGSIKSIFSIVISFSIYSLFGTVILNIFVKIFSVTFNQIQFVPLCRFSYLICIYLSLFLFLRLINLKKMHIHLLDTFSNTNKRIIFINLIIGLITLSMQLFLTCYYGMYYTIWFSILNFVCFIAYLCVSIISLNRTMNLQIKTSELEVAKEYNNTLSTLYDNVKGFKHDFNNMIHIIGGYIESNDMDGLVNYYNGLRKDCVRVNNAELLNPNIINNSGIYGLIVAKQNKATELKVNISLEVFFDFNNIHMPIYDFSRMLGILLDNAIEAASECDEKQINLMFRESARNNTQIISIENTYNDKNVDTKAIFEKGVSGKKEHTGIGLWEVNQIIYQNNNIVLHTTKDDTYFKQQLEIYY